MSWLEAVTDALDDAAASAGRAAAAPVAPAGRAAAAPVPVFFRDEDPGGASVVPVDLAVIPCALGPELARELLARDVGLHQHGLAHANHEREGRKHEFGPSRAAARQRADIAAGRARLEALLGDRVGPIFTPPWNRCTIATGRCLAEL